MEKQLLSIERKLSRIEVGIYGNGKPGLKDRITTLEVKLWIVFILLIPVACWSIKQLVLVK